MPTPFRNATMLPLKERSAATAMGRVCRLQMRRVCRTDPDGRHVTKDACGKRKTAAEPKAAAEPKVCGIYRFIYIYI